MKGYSLQWRLVFSIVAVFVLLWSLVFSWLYIDLEKRLQTTLDERLSGSAHMVARLIRHLPLHEVVNTLETQDAAPASQNLIACEISILGANISTGQRVIARTQGVPTRLNTQKLGFSTWQDQGVEWRSYVLKKGEIQVVTAEKLQLRYSLLRQILQSVLIPLILTLILCIFLILWIIRIEFQPLDQITHNIIEKKQHLSATASYLQQLKTQHIPNEIQPFVDSLLEFIQSLHQRLEHEKSLSAFAAHELRSPLTAIKTHVQLAKLMLMQNESSSEKILQNMLQAEASVQRYEQLLEKLLLLSQIENQSQLRIEMSEVRLTLEQVITELQQKYADLNSRLQVDWCSLSAIDLSSATLAIVLKNLIENAYLHTAPNTLIEISMLENTLIVSDQGQGVSDHELTLLSQRFWRKSAQGAGHGLGLNLVKVLLEKHGYSIMFRHHQPTGLTVVICRNSSV